MTENAVLLHYRVVRRSDRKLFLQTYDNLVASGDTEVLSFRWPGPLPSVEKEAVYGEGKAALHAAEALGDPTVHWIHNGVELDTVMYYTGDVWASYTELNSIMAN